MAPKSLTDKNNIRPPSVVIKNNKQKDNKLDEKSNKLKPIAKLIEGPQNNNRNKSKEKTSNLKTIKVPKNIDNTMDNNEDIDLLNLIQEKNKNNINISQKKENLDESIKNIRNQNNFNNDCEKESIKIVPEVKMTPNISAINKLIDSSSNILNDQKKILENFADFGKRLSVSESEVQKLTNKIENDEFSQFVQKYSGCLDEVLEVLKNHNEEVENIKCKK